MQEKETANLLLGLRNSRDSFSLALKEQLQNNQETVHIGESTCEQQHKFSNFLLEIFARFFNVMSKNLISEENDKIHENRKRAAADKKSCKVSKKAKKLQSQK